MPRRPTRKPWVEAEVVVLCAIFTNVGFSAGDDERIECRRIAAAFGRSPGTIDRQWRNIKDYLAGMPCEKVGELVRIWSDTALSDPYVVSQLARYYCNRNGWKIDDLLRSPA